MRGEDEVTTELRERNVELGGLKVNKPMFIIPLTLHNILICHIPPVKWGPLILVNFAECNCLVLGDGVSRQMNYVIDEDQTIGTSLHKYYVHRIYNVKIY